jgi:hypothetical protein
LVGFDVLIESQNIFVLEVNVALAMGTTSELDLRVKQPLTVDLFNLVLLPNKQR